MFGWCCNSCLEIEEEELITKPFSLPSPLPKWPQGKGFGRGKITLGEIDVVQITKFDKIWSCNPSRGKAKGVTFYKPSAVPDGFFILGHYCQPTGKQLRGYVLVAKAVDDRIQPGPALATPLGYRLVWSSDSPDDGRGYIWQPNAPEGYKPMGFVVTVGADEPGVEGVRCVRADLTEGCEASEVVFDLNSLRGEFYVWNTRPCRRGVLCRGVPLGTFFCSQVKDCGDGLSVACLRNVDSSLRAMPNLDQIHALVEHYGPTLYFHPDELYLPSSVSWFFENGAVLYEKGREKGVAVDCKGSNLPYGGENDGEFWLGLPDDDSERDYLKRGNIESAALYVHVKPALGGTFTDIAMWSFCPFNGPATLKAGLWSYTFNRIGQHVGDWEHFTLRVSNFKGELWSVYFSEHSGGEWLDACDLEFIEGNKPVVYASKNGHASFPHEGCYIQGSSGLGIGARNDCAKSKYVVDSSVKYQIVSGEYLSEDVVTEPHWLQYMREWGPTVVYNSMSELERILNNLPFFVRFSLENVIELFPTEVYGEEGPTGPKEKDNWLGDERC